MIYPYNEYMTHKMNYVSLSCSINKLCLHCIHFFVLFGLNVISRWDSFHAGKYFSSVPTCISLKTLLLNFNIYGRMIYLSKFHLYFPPVLYLF